MSRESDAEATATTQESGAGASRTESSVAEQTARDAYLEGWSQESAEGVLEEALEHYRRCIALGASSDKETAARALLRIALITRAQGKSDESQASLERLAQQFSGTRAASEAKNEPRRLASRSSTGRSSAATRPCRSIPFSMRPARAGRTDPFVELVLSPPAGWRASNWIPTEGLAMFVNRKDTEGLSRLAGLYGDQGAVRALIQLKAFDEIVGGIAHWPGEARQQAVQDLYRLTSLPAATPGGVPRWPIYRSEQESLLAAWRQAIGLAPHSSSSTPK